MQCLDYRNADCAECAHIRGLFDDPNKSTPRKFMKHKLN